MGNIIKKWQFKVILIILIIFTAFYFISVHYQKNDAQLNRTIELQNNDVDYQSILQGFDNTELTIDGAFVNFVGHQKIDASVFEGIDNLSFQEKEELQENNNVQYHFTYDAELNIVTIEAIITLPNGEIIIDKIEGVGFYNDNGEIDAVMNIDGEGILLSEMRDSGMIANAGLFSILKNIAIGVAVVAAVVVVVATAGAAAPAVVAVGVGVVTASAATIATTAAITAAVAAGVAITAAVLEKSYPGIGASTQVINGQQVLTAQWSKDKTKQAVKDIVAAEKNKSNPKQYFRVTSYTTSVGPVTIEINPYDKATMSSKMSLQGWSSLTALSSNAFDVIKKAFPNLNIKEDERPHGMRHWHGILSNGSHASVKVGTSEYTVHSWFYA